MIFQIYNIEKKGINEVMLYGKEHLNGEPYSKQILVKKVISDVYFLPVPEYEEKLQNFIMEVFKGKVVKIELVNRKNIFYKNFNLYLKMLKVQFNCNVSVDNFFSDECLFVFKEFSDPVENFIISKKLKGVSVVEIDESKYSVNADQVTLCESFITDLRCMKIASLAVKIKYNKITEFVYNNGTEIFCFKEEGKLKEVIDSEKPDLIITHNLPIKKYILHKTFLHCDLYSFAMGTIKGRDYSVEELCNKYSVEYESGITNEAKILLSLFNKMDALSLAKEMAEISGSLLNRCFMNQRAERIEYTLLHELYGNEYLMPLKNNPQTETKYSGGLVLEPKRGFYEKIVVLLDFNSLYPSIIQEFNVCFSTVGLKGENFEGVNEDVLFLPKIIKKIVSRRYETKKLMKTVEVTSEEYKLLNVKQLVLKLTANSIYGCLGFSNSRFCNFDMASFITSKGREILTKSKEIAEEHKIDVIYGDTDSLMVATPFNNIKSNFQAAIEYVNTFKDEVNKMYKHIVIDVECCFLKLLLYTKKKYAGLIYDLNLSPHLEIKGMDVIRRDFCKASQTISSEILKIILENSESSDSNINYSECNNDGEIASKIYKICSSYYNSLEDLPKAEFVISATLSKKLSSYEFPTNLPQVKLAQRLEKEGKNFAQGEIINFVIGKGTGNISDRAFLLSEDCVIDYDYYIKSQILPPIFRIVDLIKTIRLTKINLIFNVKSFENAIQAQDSLSLNFITDCCQNIQKKQDKCFKCNKELSNRFYLTQVLSMLRNHEIHKNLSAKCPQCAKIFTNGLFYCFYCKCKLQEEENYNFKFDKLLSTIENTFKDNQEISEICEIYSKSSGFRMIDLNDYFD